MKRQFVIFSILLLSLLASFNTSLAAPPQPLKVNVVIDPPTVHLGDTVTFHCVYISPGNTYPIVQFSASYPGRDISVRPIHNDFDQNGSHIIEITFVAERSGTITCKATATIDGKKVTVQNTAELVVVP